MSGGPQHRSEAGGTFHGSPTPLAETTTSTRGRANVSRYAHCNVSANPTLIVPQRRDPASPEVQAALSRLSAVVQRCLLRIAEHEAREGGTACP